MREEQKEKEEPLNPPIEFKANTMDDKLNIDYEPIDKNKEFKQSEEVRVDFIKPLNIFLSAVICLSFYLILILIIKKPDTYLIILFAIIIFVGHFAQSQVIPEFPSFLSKEEFESKIEEILNSDVKIIKSKDKNNGNYYLTDLIKCTIDVTGQIEIPKKDKLIKFDEFKLYTKKETREEFEKLNAESEYEICLYKSGKCIHIPEEIYWIGETPISRPVNELTIILSLLLLQWIQALYYIIKWKMVIIYPIKLAISEIEQEFAQTNINVHGQKYLSNKTAKAPNQNDKKNTISFDENVLNTSQSPPNQNAINNTISFDESAINNSQSLPNQNDITNNNRYVKIANNKNTSQLPPNQNDSNNKNKHDESGGPKNNLESNEAAGDG